MTAKVQKSYSPPPTLTGILTYHVVLGRLDSKTQMDMIKAGNGVAELKTVTGGKLWVMLKGKHLWLNGPRA